MPVSRQVGAVLLQARALRAGNKSLELEHLNLTSNTVKAVRSTVLLLCQSKAIKHCKYVSTQEFADAYQPG